jgi:DNA repair photolyase
MYRARLCSSIDKKKVTKSQLDTRELIPRVVKMRIRGYSATLPLAIGSNHDPYCPKTDMDPLPRRSIREAQARIKVSNA